MNIFMLDEDPVLAAQYHCDKHVVKMILETAQTLSTTCRIRGLYREPMYKSTHQNHPCTIWARQSAANYSWTYQLFGNLLREYEHRYRRTHASAQLIGVLEPDAGDDMPWPRTGWTTPAQAMPDRYKDPDPVVAYRRYYAGEKAQMLNYTNRSEPSWLAAYLEESNANG